VSASNSHFDLIAGEYDESLPAHVVEHYLAKRVTFVLDHCPRGRALDVGCGTGVLAERLARAGYRVTGADPSEGMLKILRERTDAVTVRHASGEQLPFPDGEFDLTLTVAVLHHIADPGAVRTTLAEMVRVTHPGGAILIWDHNPRNPYWKSLMARVPQDTGQERLIPEREIITGLRRAGARIVYRAPLGLVPDFTPPAALAAAAALERGVERIPGLRQLCAHNVILATKE
jgi:ubiquinone/menaquinone biosynthesis C-methylase UbiE